MRKPTHLSHYLIVTALINGERVTTADSQAFYTSRIENIISEFRSEGISFQEDVKENSRFSWYKPYVLVQTKENFERAKELQDRYQKNVDDFEKCAS